MKTSKWTSTVCIGNYQIGRFGDVVEHTSAFHGMPLAPAGGKQRLISFSPKTTVTRDILSLWLKYQYNRILNA